MNFGELCQEVMDLTNRPSLVKETQSQVRAATTFMHLVDFWMRDADERQVTFAASSFGFQFDIKSLFSNFRKIRYIRKYDPATNTAGDYITPCDPLYLYDEFKQKKSNVYYMSGDTINILSSTGETAFLVGWYKYPSVYQNYSSWIADVIPTAIIEYAVGRVLVMTGSVEEGNKFVDPQKGSVFVIQVPLIRTNDILPGV